ncbi:hypothetical protein ACFWQC_21605 [Nocardioides sp. NPDC058538]|uniref:hypothetical protein n=1 Tax=Nocardioides sp. NPDC058538 TaxID=3346542 RepID=UPI003663385C
MPTVEAPPDWVPVERRWLGMDRRTLLPAGVVALLVAITFWVLPGVDSLVAVDDPIKAGDVIQVGRSVGFDPAVGWNLESGLRSGSATSGTYPDSATLTKDGVTFTVTTGEFDGSATALLAQLRKNNGKLGPNALDLQSGTAATFRTASEITGVIARFSTTTVEGLLGALVSDGQGIEVTVYGPADMAGDRHLENQIVAMLESVRLVDGDAS